VPRSTTEPQGSRRGSRFLTATPTSPGRGPEMDAAGVWGNACTAPAATRRSDRRFECTTHPESCRGTDRAGWPAAHDSRPQIAPPVYGARGAMLRTSAARATASPTEDVWMARTRIGSWSDGGAASRPPGAPS
jgi:hypothetical protein